MSELVSIITPMYNSEKFIESAINSVAIQTYHNWEMIIIDDGSTDDSVELAPGASHTLATKLRWV